MDQQRRIWIKEEVTEMIPSSPGSMLLEDPLKIDEPGFDIKEESKMVPTEHNGLVTALMNQQRTIWMKEEVTEVISSPPASLLLEDPLKIEEPGFDMKEESNMISSEHNVGMCKEPNSFEYDPLRTKKEEDLICENDCPGEYDLLSLTDHKIDIDKESNSPECDPLRTKNEEGLIYENGCPDEYDPLSLTDDKEIASKRCAPGRTRLTKVTGETGSTAFEETHLWGVTGDELDTAAEKSARFLQSRIPEQVFFSQEVTALVTKNYYNLEDHDFSCSSCKQTFSSKYSLIMHVFHHIDGVQPPEHICKWCGEVFISHDSLRKHFVMWTVISRENCNQHSTVSTELASPRYCEEVCTGKRPLECDLSNKLFPSSHSQGLQKSDVNEDCFRQPDNLISRTVIDIVEKLYKCAFCAKTFSCSEDLKCHTLMQWAENQHKCGVCGKSFTHSGAIKRHCLTHTGERPHKCSVCGKSFSRSGALKKHCLTHTGERPHKCSVCGKSFTEYCGLKRHSLTHTGESPYKCRVCGKSFTRSSTLKTHDTIHTGEKPHKCSVCGKLFAVVGHLKKHALIHTGEKPHKCSVCGKSFTESDGLKRHFLTHTGERPYKCSVCGKSFTWRSNLKRHILIHTDVRAQ